MKIKLSISLQLGALFHICHKSLLGKILNIAVCLTIIE